ncbi:MAG: pyruvate kinase [Alphaproteobacteria bacterium]
MISALFAEGVDIFRLNFSHGTHQEHAARLDVIRRMERKHGRPIGVIADLQGPKLRVGTFPGGPVQLHAGGRFRLELGREAGDADGARLPHPEIFQALEIGTDVLLNDGRIRLRILDCGDDFADTEVITGGELSDRKGVNVPGVVLPLSALTDKDRTDLRFALDSGVDWIALSFVQRPEDVAEARRLIAGRAAVLIKLEKPAAIQRLDELIDLADAVMVARGDLGVELPPEDVPSLQKQIVRVCRDAGKPVIVATQMLESMISAPAPTRAEASDVATAVYDGADAVMLSAETAAGQYPREAVGIMDRIIRRTESDPHYRALLDADHWQPLANAADAISAAARQVARTIGAAAIVTYTTSGATALRASRERPDVPILGLTSDMRTARRLALVWGVHSVHTADVTSFASMVVKARAIAHRTEYAGIGDKIVITAGVPFGTPGATNILRIAWIERE